MLRLSFVRRSVVVRLRGSVVVRLCFVRVRRAQSVLRLVHLWSVGGSVVRRAERLTEGLAERRVERPSCGALEGVRSVRRVDKWSVRRVHLMFL